ncbi:hypothetical protein VNO77_34214 [Canavalia gladiata]|uniref:26S proteasome non-ATPase regulatory subunit 1/RPN2 N-terminal domain-containing protein n=1 Tax=Canavalia gladiata TaxID=3824 RepID=A0AAN9Q1K4_CANGL
MCKGERLSVGALDSWNCPRPPRSQMRLQNGCDTGAHSGYATGWSIVRRQLASLLVSKIFHYLGELNDSVSYALGAGPLFDVSEVSDCGHTLLAKAIDEYASSKSKAAESSDESIKVDSRLEATTGSDNVQGTPSYCIYVPHSFVNLKEYRKEILHILVKVFQKLPSPDYLSIGQCFMSLDGPEGVASILEKLLRSENKDDALLALQIAFDLVGNEHQAFLLNVKDRLASLKSQPPELHDVQMTEGGSASAVSVPEDPMETIQFPPWFLDQSSRITAPGSRQLRISYTRTAFDQSSLSCSSLTERFDPILEHPSLNGNFAVPLFFIFSSKNQQLKTSFCRFLLPLPARNEVLPIFLGLPQREDPEGAQKVESPLLLRNTRKSPPPKGTLYQNSVSLVLPCLGLLAYNHVGCSSIMYS